MLGDFEEDRKPDIEYLDALNEHNKRSRSVEDEGEAERKQARVGAGAGAGGAGGAGDGWGHGQGQENGGELLSPSMNGAAESSETMNAEGVIAEDDPIVYGPLFLSMLVSVACSMEPLSNFSGWQTNAVLPGWRGTSRPHDGGRICSLL